MKKILYFTLAFALFHLSSNLLFAQVSGDYRTVNGVGDWNNEATWETYNGSSWNAASQEPTTSNDVSILSGHTVNIVSNTNSKNLTISGSLVFGSASATLSYSLNLIGDLTVENGGDLSIYNAEELYEHEVFISGNIVNNGTITTLSSSNNDALYFNFNGTEDVQVSGNSISFSGLTINLTAGKTADFTSIISFSDPENNGFRLFQLTSGIFKLSSASTIAPFSGASTIPAAAGFFLNHANSVSNWGSSGSLDLNGLLRIDNGIMNIGSTSGNKLDVNGSGAEYIMNGGTLNISGYWDQTSNGKAAINNGTINVLKNSSVSNSVDIINIPNTCEFVMNNGSFNVKNLNTGSGATLYINKNSNSSISGGTFSISNTENVTTEAIIYIDEDLSFYDLTVDIGSTASVEDILSNVVVSNNLTIQSGTIKINPALGLTVSGTLTNNAGASGLMIKSDGAATGSLIQNTAGVDATMERYMNNADWTNWQDGWHFLGSPVADHAINPAFTTDPATGYDFYLWNEPTNEWVNFKNQSGGGGTAPFFDDINGSNNFVLGRGYMAAYDAEGVKSFSGALNVADVPVSGLAITGTSGNKSWHLLGNPFSSALIWDGSDEWALTNIAGVAKIWNEANQSYTDLTSSPSTTIPATNGFMVQVSEGTGSLTIPAAKREHSSQAFYKSSVSGMMLTARSHAAGNAQEARIVINPDATAGFDLMFDSDFLAGHAPSFYSIAGEYKLSTNSLPELTAETEIPFAFMKNAGSQFSIEASGFEDVPGIPHLYDLKTGASQNLADNPVYNFTAQDSDNPNRFLLKFESVSVNEIGDASALHIYANGSTVYLNSSENLDARIAFYNITGQQVHGQRLVLDGLKQISLNLPTGWYVVSVTSDKEMTTQKVFIR
jgi:hypothetical protein